MLSGCEHRHGMLEGTGHAQHHASTLKGGAAFLPAVSRHPVITARDDTNYLRDNSSQGRSSFPGDHTPQSNQSMDLHPDPVFTMMLPASEMCISPAHESGRGLVQQIPSPRLHRPGSDPTQPKPQGRFKRCWNVEKLK